MILKTEDLWLFLMKHLMASLIDNNFGIWRQTQIMIVLKMFKKFSELCFRCYKLAYICHELELHNVYYFVNQLVIVVSNANHIKLTELWELWRQPTQFRMQRPTNLFPNKFSNYLSTKLTNAALPNSKVSRFEVQYSVLDLNFKLYSLVKL